MLIADFVRLSKVMFYFLIHVRFFLFFGVYAYIYFNLFWQLYKISTSNLYSNLSILSTRKG